MSPKIKARWPAFLIVPFLYVLFSVTSALAGPIGLVALLLGKPRTLGHVTRSMDALAAAELSIFFPHWDGRKTVSTECGKDNANPDIDCKFCRWLCKALELMEHDHCARLARTDE